MKWDDYGDGLDGFARTEVGFILANTILYRDFCVNCQPVSRLI